MPRRLISLVQIEVFLIVNRRACSNGEVSIGFPGPSLSASGMEMIHRDAYRNAGVALAAVRTIDKIATAAESEPHETRILMAVEQMMRVKEQFGRGPLRQIAAWMRHRKKYLRWFQITRHIVVHVIITKPVHL